MRLHKSIGEVYWVDMTWDYPKDEYEKQAAMDPKWHFERRILYGLEGEKLDRDLLMRLFPELHIPANRRAFFELLLWNKIS